MGDRPISQVVADGVENSVVYPMWVVSCPIDGFICTVWEKPGTGCSYFEYCPDCGGHRIETTKVTDKQNHERTIDRVNSQADR